LTSDQPQQNSITTIPLIGRFPKENLQMTTATEYSSRLAQLTALDKELTDRRYGRRLLRGYARRGLSSDCRVKAKDAQITQIS
jgi:hypothetical protein